MGQNDDEGRKIDTEGRLQHWGQAVKTLRKEGEKSDFVFFKILTPFEK